jgi:hypothetical protein
MTLRADLDAWMIEFTEVQWHRGKLLKAVTMSANGAASFRRREAA